MTDIYENAQEFDVSNVTLKELRDVWVIVKQEIQELDQARQKKTLSPEMNQRYGDLHRYDTFLWNSIQTKTIDELNKQYFGGKISLKNKLLEAEVVDAEVVDADGCVEYEPLYPVMKNT